MTRSLMGRVLDSCRRFFGWPFIFVSNVRPEFAATLPNSEQMSRNFIVDCGKYRKTSAKPAHACDSLTASSERKLNPSTRHVTNFRNLNVFQPVRHVEMEVSSVD